MSYNPNEPTILRKELRKSVLFIYFPFTLSYICVTQHEVIGNMSNLKPSVLSDNNSFGVGKVSLEEVIIHSDELFYNLNFYKMIESQWNYLDITENLPSNKSFPI